jgi:hypothetical protein
MGEKKNIYGVLMGKSEVKEDLDEERRIMVAFIKYVMRQICHIIYLLLKKCARKITNF